MNILDAIIIVAAIAYAIGGFRSGAVVGVLSMIGFFGGAAIGAQIAGPIGSRLVDGRARVPVAIVCVLLLAMIGQLLGAWIAGNIRSRVVVSHHRRAFDSGVGSAIGVVSVLLVAWMVAVPLATSPYPQLAAQASHSRIVRAVNDVMPQDVRTLYGSLRNFLNQSGFPPVFGDLPTPPNVQVAPPDPTLPRAAQQAVDRAHVSTLKVYGEAPRCGRGIEGSGFVFAPHRVMTNAHVVAGTSQVAVQVSANRNLAATVVLYDPERDVAVLDVPGLAAPALDFAAHPASTGDPAIVLGSPQDGPFTVHSARVRTPTVVSGNDIYGDGNVRREIYGLRAVIRSGNSGGPLLADDGTVLGVVFATALDSPDTGYALTAAEVAPDAARGRTARAPVATGACTQG